MEGGGYRASPEGSGTGIRPGIRGKPDEGNQRDEGVRDRGPGGTSRDEPSLHPKISSGGKNQGNQIREKMERYGKKHERLLPRGNHAKGGEADAGAPLPHRSRGPGRIRKTEAGR